MDWNIEICILELKNGVMSTAAIDDDECYIQLLMPV